MSNKVVNVISFGKSLSLYKAVIKYCYILSHPLIFKAPFSVPKALTLFQLFDFDYQWKLMIEDNFGLF